MTDCIRRPKNTLVGEVGDNVFSTQNMRSARPVLAGIGDKGLTGLENPTPIAGLCKVSWSTLSKYGQPGSKIIICKKCIVLTKSYPKRLFPAPKNDVQRRSGDDFSFKDVLTVDAETYTEYKGGM